MRTPSSLPRGAVLPDHDRPARALRVSAHPEVGLIVLSVWEGARCKSTVRLSPDDVPDLVQALSTAAVVTASRPSAAAS